MSSPNPKAYLGGPMSGLPQFNFPAFDAASAHLREQGWDIVSPAELDEPAIREAALASPDGKPITCDPPRSWMDFLARDLKIVVDQVEAIVLLPGWDRSRGAVLESFVGILTGKDFYLYDPLDGTRRVPTSYVLHYIKDSKVLR